MADEDPENIDWGLIRDASINLAELLWSHHQALIAAGFSEAAALRLTVGYQQVFLQQSQ